MTTDVSTRYDAIVIGSGLGGLMAAAYLSVCGRRTLLLEQYSVLGGASHVFRRQGQWEFDVGVHYLGGCGPGGHVRRMFGGLGIRDAMEFRQLDPDGFDTVVGPDFELRVPANWQHFLENMIRAFPADEYGLRRYFSVLTQIARNLDQSRTLASKRAQIRLAVSSRSSAPWLLAPHIALLRACDLSPRAVKVLSMYSGGFGSMPRSAPVAMQAGYAASYIDGGAWYPRGGGQALTAHLTRVLLAHGGTVRTRDTVERIVIVEGRVAGVVTSSGAYSAPAVVSNVDIKQTYDTLVGPEHLPRSMVRRVRRWSWAWPLFSAYFGLGIDLRTGPNTNYFVIPTWEDTRSHRDRTRATKQLITAADRRDPVSWAADFARTQTAFVHSGTSRDPDNVHSAPPGCSAIEALVVAPRNPALWGATEATVADGSYRQGALYREIKEMVTQGMLDRVETLFPGARSALRWSEASTPATHERFTLSPSGLGLEPRVGQFGLFRPGVRTQIEGLFLAGASTTWGPGTTGAMLSGLHAAGAIVGRDLDAELRSGAVLATRSASPTDGFDPLAASRGFAS